MDVHELVLTAVRAAAVYVLMLIVIRALGKRTVGNFSAFDLLIALMLGEVVDEIIYGDVRFIQGTVAIVALGALAYGDAWLSYWSRTAQRITEGLPTVIVRDGQLDRHGMRAERMNEFDVLAMLRQQGIHDLREIHLAVVEADGAVSVLKQTWAEPAQRADVLKEADRERMQALGDQATPPPHLRTDSPQALGRG
ncbi:MAG TPA: YetF domain-containing protein [Vicinamibacterales bacterium]|nr:YetF domain-containing protein [Vicinamibacterales bacterium]